MSCVPSLLARLGRALARAQARKSDAPSPTALRTRQVGVSMGGMIALKMAALIPSRIASLLLGVTSAGHGIRRKLPPVRPRSASAALALARAISG